VEHRLSHAKRMVIKIGSALLVESRTGQLHHQWLKTLLEDIVFYWKQGLQIVIVSSGAIALGRLQLDLKKRVLLLEEKQASAAVGQIKLAHAYQEGLKSHGVSVAQILLTLDDSKNEMRRQNAKNTLETLLSLNIIPVINENDAVATDEIRYGDNDRLAAHVAQMIQADTLVLLSDIEGLYTSDPKRDPNAKFIAEVTHLTPDILAMASDDGTEYGSGGMVTKLLAAQIALSSGCKMVIAAGKHDHPLTRIDDKVSNNTWFIPGEMGKTGK